MRPTTILVEGVAEIGAGRTVSCCVAEAKPVAETVIVGVPGWESWYWNVADVEPAGMVIGRTAQGIAAGARENAAA